MEPEKSPSKGFPWLACSLIAGAVFILVVIVVLVLGLVVYRKAHNLPEINQITPSPSSQGSADLSATVGYTELVDITASVSSRRPDQEGETFGPFNLIDTNQATSWVSEPINDGVGESVTFTFSQAVDIESITVFPGFGRTWEEFNQYGQPARLAVYWDGGSMEADLEYDMNYQTIVLPGPVTTETISLEILEVFPGDTYVGVAISDFTPY